MADDVVILEAAGPRAFHFTFTGYNLQPRTFFPGNRINVPQSLADLIVANPPPAPSSWVQRFNGNDNEWGPPWPASTQGTPYGAPIAQAPPEDPPEG